MVVRPEGDHIRQEVCTALAQRYHVMLFRINLTRGPRFQNPWHRMIRTRRTLEARRAAARPDCGHRPHARRFAFQPTMALPRRKTPRIGRQTHGWRAARQGGVAVRPVIVSYRPRHRVKHALVDARGLVVAGLDVAHIALADDDANRKTLPRCELDGSVHLQRPLLPDRLRLALAQRVVAHPSDSMCEGPHVERVAHYGIGFSHACMPQVQHYQLVILDERPFVAVPGIRRGVRRTALVVSPIRYVNAGCLDQVVNQFPSSRGNVVK